VQARPVVGLVLVSIHHQSAFVGVHGGERAPVDLGGHPGAADTVDHPCGEVHDLLQQLQQVVFVMHGTAQPYHHVGDVLRSFG